MSECNHNTPLPPVMGNEEEAAVYADTQLVSFLYPFMPTDLVAAQAVNNQGRFYDNGYKAYQDKNHFEVATPECTDPESIATYIRGTESLLVESVENYMISQQVFDRQKTIVIQRRVVDTAGNSWGCHDNFSVKNDFSEKLMDNASLEKAALIGHLATRSFVSGAGNVFDDQFFYAQKARTVDSLHSYDWVSSLFRVETVSNAHENRLEIRNSDINISDWATRIRFGSVALALMISRSEYKNELYKIHPNRAISAVKAMNVAELAYDGTIAPSRDLMQAIDAQHVLAEASLRYFDKHGSNEQYQAVANELYSYCDDMKSVLRHEQPITILSNRADWAAKLQFIISDIAKSPDIDSRSPFDVRAQVIDLEYDKIELRSIADGTISRKYGLGYRWRDKNRFKDSIPNPQAEYASRHAPENTRAFIRSRLIAEHVERKPIVDWHRVMYVDGAIKHEYTLINPANNTLPSDSPTMVTVRPRKKQMLA